MNKFKEYSELPTEKINPYTKDLDRIPLKKILEKLNDEDQNVPIAVRKEIPKIEKAAKLLSETFLANKNIFFVGAGTSGRLGILEAVELVPTYGVKPKQFVAFIAGGRGAMFKAKEGAEDVYEEGFKLIKKKGKEGDLLIAIAASGITPYVRGAIDSAKKIDMKTIFVNCNKNEKLKNADITIAVDVGPEPINGSTRMKSGTATKLILNMITTSAMAISGKIYHNWMVDVKPTNYKLIMRAERVFSQITGLPCKKAKYFLKKTNYKLKEAIIMAKSGLNLNKAKKLLKEHKGFLKNIIEKNG